MRRSYDYEFKQESHSLHEKRSSWSTNNYPSYGEKKYYVAPPTNTMQKMVHNKPSFHYEPSDDEDDHHHDHIAAINDVYDNRRWVHRGHDDVDRGWCETHRGHDDVDRGWCETHHANNQANIKNKNRGPMLRPPSHQYRHPTVIDQGGEVENQNAWRYGEASRMNNKNRVMEDYPRKYIPNYGEDSRLEDEYDNNAGIGDNLKSLIKGLHGKVKKIEVIEYERTTYRGAREEWRMLGGNDAPTNYPNNSHFYGNYPKSNAPRVKGF